MDEAKIAKTEIEDTYAEAFRSLYAEVLVTAASKYWLDQAIQTATGNASSTIMCDCEAGLDRYIGLPDSNGTDEKTPDGRPGAILQFHVPRFRKDRVEALEKSLLVRISQNILTCPTCACFNVMQDSETYFKMGRKIAFFGEGYQYRAEKFGRKGWVIPILSGEFFIERRIGYQDGLMGGNLWLMGSSPEAALRAAELGVEAAAKIPGVIMPFPGGVAASGSKAGSKYKFSIAGTYLDFCPSLKDKLGDQSRVPDGVVSIQEIILNGKNLETISRATQAAIQAMKDIPGLIKISAGNYGGRLGKSFIYLLPEKNKN